MESVVERGPFKHFVHPNLEAELGEIERVANIFDPDNKIIHPGFPKESGYREFRDTD